MKFKKFSLFGSSMRLHLALAFLGLTLLVCALLFVVTGISTHHYMREQVRQRLMGIAATSALFIDGDLHERLNTDIDKHSKAYLAIQSRLTEIDTSTPGISQVYTIIPDKDSVDWTLAVDAGETLKSPLSSDGSYNVNSVPQIWNALKSPAADLDLAPSHNGFWLSGYAPIRNSQGKTVAILGLGMSESEVSRQEHSIIYGIGLAMVALIILSVLLANKLALYFARPLNSLVAASAAVAEGKLDTKVDVSGSREIQILGASFNSMIRSMRAHHNELLELGNTDFLTGLRNHRYFQDRLIQEIKRADTHDRKLALAMIDLDHFRIVNTQFGHLAGDAVLKQVADIIKTELRDCDIITRYGGEEFAVVMPETDRDEAFEISERIRIAIFDHAFVLPKALSRSTVNISASIGVAEYPTDSTEREGIIMAADLSLYQAKHISRNRVCRYWRMSEDTDAIIDPAYLKAAIYDGSLAAVESLAEALEARDGYTRGHSENVAKIAVDLAKHMGLPVEFQQHLRTACLLHDIGKIGIPDAILKKKGSLSEDERVLIKTHPSLGAVILGKVPMLREIIPAILHHHERWDGSGYPDGLKGDQIPLTARIMAVADTFDAMTSDRPYRSNMSKEITLAEIFSKGGVLFDPKVVHHFVEMMLGNSLQNEESYFSLAEPQSAAFDPASV